MRLLHGSVSSWQEYHRSASNGTTLRTRREGKRLIPWPLRAAQVPADLTTRYIFVCSIDAVWNYGSLGLFG